MTITQENGTGQVAPTRHHPNFPGTKTHGVLGAADDNQCQETADGIGRDFPNWLVLWGTYTRQFVAFPVFRAPPGAFVTAYRPGPLTARMRDTERKLGISPAKGSTNADDA